MVGISQIAGTAIGFIGGIFSDGKDPERKIAIDNLKAASLAGDGDAFIRLQCLAGDTAIGIKYPALDPRNDGKPACSGFATDYAIGYAQAAVQEVKLKMGIGNAAGVVGGAAAAAGAATSPTAFLAGATGATPQQINTGTRWAVVGAVVILAFLIVRK